MIYYKCIDKETEYALNQCNEVTRMFFYNVARLVNSGGGIVIAYDVLPPGIIKLRAKWMPKGKRTYLPYPFQRMMKIVAAVNAVTVVDQNNWPVRYEKDVINGNSFNYLQIALSATANATYLRHNRLFSESLHAPLHSLPLPQPKDDSDTTESETPSSDLSSHDPQETGVDDEAQDHFGSDERIDSLEMQAPE